MIKNTKNKYNKTCIDTKCSQNGLYTMTPIFGRPTEQLLTEKFCRFGVNGSAVSDTSVVLL